MNKHLTIKYCRHQLILLFAFLILFTGCKKFLDQDALGSLQADQLTNKAGINGLLIGAYGALDGQNINGGASWPSSPSHWIYGSVAGGDAHKGSDLGDQPAIVPIATGNSDAANGFFNNRWITFYEGVTRANAVLSAIATTTSPTLTNADKIQFAAEARFLRGHYYFELKKFFNMVPWISDSTTDLNQPNDKDIWPFIENDFKFAADNLKESNVAGRANNWAAKAYLAKTYLYQKKFSEAKVVFDDVIANGKTSNGQPYGLNDRFEDNFDAARNNSKESVFAIQMAANDGSNSAANGNNGDVLNFPYGGPFPCCGFFQPSVDLANSYRTDALGLPYLDNYNDETITLDMGVKDTDPFTPYQGRLDPRIDWTIGRRGIPFNDWGIFPGIKWIRNQPSGGPFANKKNIFWQNNPSSFIMSSRSSSININVIRFADVLLLAAECEAQLPSPDLKKATDYVNMVRERAAQPESKVYTYADPSNPLGGFTQTPAANYVIGQYAVPFASKAFALKAIYFERKLELACEGHRFFDLARWDIGEATLNAYYAFESKITADLPNPKFTSGKNEYYPIPQAQIDLMNRGGKELLKQNPGY